MSALAMASLNSNRTVTETEVEASSSDFWLRSNIKCTPKNKVLRGSFVALSEYLGNRRLHPRELTENKAQRRLTDKNKIEISGQKSQQEVAVAKGWLPAKIKQ